MNEYTDACRRHAQVGAKMKHNNQEIAAWDIKTQLREEYEIDIVGG